MFKVSKTHLPTLDPKLMDSLKVKPKGNLTSWLAKHKKTPTEPMTNRSNKEIMEIYTSEALTKTPSRSSTSTQRP